MRFTAAPDVDASATRLPPSDTVAAHPDPVVSPLPNIGTKKSYSTPWALLDSDSDEGPCQKATENVRHYVLATNAILTSVDTNCSGSC